MVMSFFILRYLKTKHTHSTRASASQLAVAFETDLRDIRHLSDHLISHVKSVVVLTIDSYQMPDKCLIDLQSESCIDATWLQESVNAILKSVMARLKKYFLMGSHTMKEVARIKNATMNAEEIELCAEIIRRFKRDIKFMDFSKLQDYAKKRIQEALQIKTRVWLEAIATRLVDCLGSPRPLAD